MPVQLAELDRLPVSLTIAQLWPRRGGQNNIQVPTEYVSSKAAATGPNVSYQAQYDYDRCLSR